jgi:hypothetical protein
VTLKARITIGLYSNIPMQGQQQEAQVVQKSRWMHHPDVDGKKYQYGNEKRSLAGSKTSFSVTDLGAGRVF